MILGALNHIYFVAFTLLLLVIFISVALFCFSYWFVAADPYLEKISAYECGFEPFVDTRVKFDVRFYLIGILFLVFDIEIMFLYPWVLCINSFDFLSILSMFIFLLILVVGFIYEWQKGALDWT